MATMAPLRGETQVTYSSRKRPLAPSDLEHEFSHSQSDEARMFWPSDADLERLLSSGQTVDESAASHEDDPASNRGAALMRLVGLWAEVAVAHAIVRAIRDPAGFVATVAGIEGAWGFGDSSEEALEELESVLIDWASLKLEDGDDDIPSMEGVHLVIAR